MELPYHIRTAYVALELLIFLAYNAFLVVGWIGYYSRKNRDSIQASTLAYSLIACSVQLVGVGLVLGYAGLLYRPAYLFVNTGFALLLYRQTSVADLRTKIGRGMTALLSNVGSWWIVGLFCIPTLIIIVRGSAISLLNIPSVGDDLLYHVPALFQWVTDHRISVFPTSVIYQNVYPFNTELLFLNPILFLHSDNFILFFHFGYSFLMYNVIGYAFAREFKVRTIPALMAGILLFLTPGVVNGVFSGYTDTIVNAFIISATYLFVRLVNDFEDRNAHRLFILSLIFLLGAKFSGVYLSGFWFVAYVALWLAKRRTVRFRAVYPLPVVILLTAAFIGLGASWYIRNYVYYGNPLAPQKVEVLGTEYFSTRNQDASFVKLGNDFFAPLLTPKGNVDFFPLMMQTNSFVDKVVNTFKNYYVFPTFFYVGATNQLGHVWAYAGIYALTVYSMLLLWKRQWRLGVAVALIGIFYVLQPYHLLIYSRYTFFIAVLGAVSLGGLLSLLKNRLLEACCAVLILSVAIYTIWPVGGIGTSQFLKRSLEHYSTGEYFTLDPHAETYLTCYDYTRLNLHGETINYIGSDPYPYMYHLYGKTLSNTVHYFYTLDPEEWNRQVISNGITAVVSVSAGPDKNFQQITQYIRNNPQRFKPMIKFESKQDGYDPCREYFVFRVVR